ncbi:hypothetical protein [Flavobacterium crassostreae]|uniref:Uncharacterized protein n=1 Tax=Flavobacterium crassostreae TaxID=1763534 RepID=A0A1B9E7R1_9FLAO|nr:hypothetical protein [Flavobacterium crassostreae]OCB77973.1 hypothetical protein LPBF_03225 [Flavobacterium crassostreae]
MIINLTSQNQSSIKRRTAKDTECQIDLRKELPLIFNAFKNASSNFEKEVSQTPIEARGRGFEASLLNSKMIHSIQTTFPNNWKYGKYKRFILRVNKYSILFKKLDNKNMPMNISTNFSSAISNQFTMSLFDEGTTSIDPILFFGYKKDRLGNIVEPKLIYIDDNTLQWTITEDNISLFTDNKFVANEIIEKTKPKIKSLSPLKKTSNQ